MVIAVLPMFDRSIPCSGRFPIIIVLAFGAAMSFGFIGGSAAAKGKIHLPNGAGDPIQFAVGGGIAVLILVLILGWWLYASSCSSENLSYRVEEVSDNVDLSQWSADAKAPMSPGIVRVVTLKIIRLQEGAGAFETRVGTTGGTGMFKCQIETGNGSCDEDVARTNPDRQVWIVSAPAKYFPLRTPVILRYRLNYLDPAAFQFPLDPNAVQNCRRCDVSYRVPPYRTQNYSISMQFPAGYDKAFIRQLVTPPSSPRRNEGTDFSIDLASSKVFSPPTLTKLEGQTAITFLITLGRN
jgi:hypothetical protein